MAEGIDRFNFHHILNYKSPALENKSHADLLSKWSIKDGLQIQAYTFDKDFKGYLLDRFIEDFFSDMNVTTTFLVAPNPAKIGIPRHFSPIGVPAEYIQYEKVNCRETSKTIFDKLLNRKGFIKKNGYIQKCFPEFYVPDDPRHFGEREIEIQDELRKMVLKEDSPHFIIYKNEEKSEFLIRLFYHLVIGGSLCQYEDYYKPYVDVATALYKDLVAVSLDGSTNDESILVSSVVVKVLGLKNEGYGLKNGQIMASNKTSVSSAVFNYEYSRYKEKGNYIKIEKNTLFGEKTDINDFCYVCIDPAKKKVFTIYHKV